MSVYTDPNCFVTTITLAAIKKFGLQSLDMQPETLRDLFQATFKTGKLPQKSFDKLNCGYTMIATDTYCNSIQGFLTCNYVMAGKPLDGQRISYNSIYDVCWGIWQYCNLLGELENGKPTCTFSDDIILYIKQVAKSQGITKLPDWMSFVDLGDTQPDQLNTDPALFQAYMQRQQGNKNKLTLFVTTKQQALSQQLKQVQQIQAI